MNPMWKVYDNLLVILEKLSIKKENRKRKRSLMEVARNDKSFRVCYVDPNPMDFQAFFGSL